jgi:hypothetical protein
MTKALSLIGERFGSLLVIERAGSISGKSRWKLLCVCGSIHFAASTDMKKGHVRSCGCQRGNLLRESRGGHGDSGRYVGGKRVARAREYVTWGAMIARCTDTTRIGYGGRGIVVCDRWRSYELFLADMGRRPPGTTLDRIDNDGPYSPENCRWATHAQQARNRRSSRLVTYLDRTATVAEWADITGISRNAIYLRLNAGWPVDKTLTEPLCQRVS